MLIFVVGKKRSGKDTFVSILEKEVGVTYYKLAAPIKNALHKADEKINITSEQWDGQGFDREKCLPLNNMDVHNLMKKSLMSLPDLNGSESEHRLNVVLGKVVLNNTEGWSIRRLMQTLGTDLVVNHFDRMYWVKRFAVKYVEHIEKVALGKASKDSALSKTAERHFVVPDTRQDHELDFARAMGATIIHVVRESQEHEHDEHITEKGLPVRDGDIVIENNGTLEEFENKVKEVIKCRLN